jgi:hypothetical protein
MRKFLIVFMLWAVIVAPVSLAFAQEYQRPINGVQLKPITPNNDKTGYYSRGLGEKGIKKTWNYYHPREERKAAALALKEKMGTTEKEKKKNTRGGIGNVSEAKAVPDVTTAPENTQQAVTPAENLADIPAVQTTDTVSDTTEPQEAPEAQEAPVTGGIGSVGGIGGVGGAGVQSE